jgi:hypothetical protein
MEGAPDLPEEVSPISTLTAEEIEELPVTFLGPTWQQDSLGAWLLPKKTLGWQIAGWCAEYLQAENEGPWKFTREQLRFVLHWYAVDEHGRFTNRKGVLQRMKGWGLPARTRSSRCCVSSSWLVRRASPTGTRPASR